MNGLTRTTSTDYGNGSSVGYAGDAAPVSPVQAAVHELARTQDVTHAQLDSLEQRLNDVLGKSLGKIGAEEKASPARGVVLLDQLQARQLSAGAISNRLASILERLVF